MSEQELSRYIKIFAGIHNMDPEKVSPIYKKDLIIGGIYLGECRNSDSAIWNGKTFTYQRSKFGDTFMESINHFEDDDGYDVFVPFILMSK